MNANELDPELLEVFTDKCLMAGTMQISHSAYDMFRRSDQLIRTFGDVRIIDKV